MRVGAVVAGLSLALGASAAPIELPAGEDPELWRAALEAADLEPGPVVSEGVRLAGGDPRWRLVVWDANGGEHESLVDPPTTEQDRHDLAALAASLLRPISLPAWPEPVSEGVARGWFVPFEPLPPLAPRGARREPAPTERSRFRPVGFVGAAPSLVLRPEVASTAAFSAWIGVRPARTWRLSLGGAATAPAGLRAVPDAPPTSTLEVRGAVAFAPGPWEFGGTVGSAWRRLADTVVPIGVAGGFLAHRFPVGPLRVRPSASVEHDLRRVDLQLGDEPLGRLDPWSIRLEVGVSWDGGPRGAG